MTRRTKRKSQAATTPHAVPLVNIAESPISWLYRRRDKDGATLISEAEFLAGEKLRADFHFAHMTPRTTADWSGTGGGGGRRGAPGAGVEIQDAVIAATERVRRALDAVGPELAGILIDVCCHLKGIEDAERRQRWPQRSGKVVLQLALARLARHYGLLRDAPTAHTAPIRHWGTTDYRPTIDAE